MAIHFISSIACGSLYISSRKVFEEKIKKDGYIRKTQQKNLRKKSLSLLKDAFCILCPCVNITVALNYYVTVNLDIFYDEYKTILIEKGKITKKKTFDDTIKEKRTNQRQVSQKNENTDKSDLTSAQKIAYLKEEKSKINNLYNQNQKETGYYKVKSNVKKFKKR